MNSKTIQAALMFIGLLMLGMFLAQWIATLPEFYQVFTICVFILIALLLVIKPKIGLDVKLLFFVCLGYAFGGKGFAYVSPFEPFFISEICLVICLLGFLLRVPSSWKFMMMPKMGLPALFIFLAYSGLRLGLIDFPRFKLLAVRDAALAYYSLFIFTTIIACHNYQNFLLIKKLIIPMGGLALVSSLLTLSGGAQAIHSVFPYARLFYSPHPDITAPLIAALAATLFLMAVKRKSMIYFFLFFVTIAAVCLSKTAGIFCFICLFASLVIFTRRSELIMSCILCLVLGVVIFGIALLLGYNPMIDSEHLDTVGDIASFDLYSGNVNTTSWRFAWWRIITEDTWNYFPLMGAGYGGDITTSFGAEVLGVELTEAEASKVGVTRYPHNIFFTVLGRLGFVVVILYTLMQIGIYLRLGKIASNYLRGSQIDYSLFMAIAFTIAGIANGYIQMTYEGPYAAIPHWVTLGFVYSYVRRRQLGLPVS